MALKRFLIGALFLLLPLSAAAQSQTGPTGPFSVNQGTSNSSDPWYVRFVTAQHFICDSGCGGGTTDTDDGSIAGGQSVALVGGLNYYWTGAAWARFAANFTGTSLDVNCTGGCGGPASFADNAAFTFGTTTIGNVGFVVDDVATNAASENSAATPRMSTNRVVYNIIRDGQLNERAAFVTASNALKVDGSAVTQPISAASLPLPTGASTLAEQQTQTTALQLIDNIVSGNGANITQFGNNNVVTGTGASGNGIPRVTISNDSSLAANQSVNVAQFGGTNVSTGIGPAASGVPRVTTSDDNTTGTQTISATTACPAVSTVVTSNTGCITLPMAGRAGGNATLINSTFSGNIVIEDSSDGGTTWSTTILSVGGQQTFCAAAVPCVFAASSATTIYNFILPEGVTHMRVRNITSVTNSTSATISATRIVSPLAVGALQISTATGTLPLFAALGAVRAATATPTAVTTATNQAPMTGDVYGVTYARVDHPARFSCVQTISTATALTLVPNCGAPGASLSRYVTDISFSTNVGAIAADTFNTLKYGTGGACGTGTTVFWGAMTPATTQAKVDDHFITPIKIPANNEICWINSTAGSKFVIVNGYVAP